MQGVNPSPAPAERAAPSPCTPPAVAQPSGGASFPLVNGEPPPSPTAPGPGCGRDAGGTRGCSCHRCCAAPAPRRSLLAALAPRGWDGARGSSWRGLHPLPRAVCSCGSVPPGEASGTLALVSRPSWLPLEVRSSCLLCGKRSPVRLNYPFIEKVTITLIHLSPFWKFHCLPFSSSSRISAAFFNREGEV